MPRVPSPFATPTLGSRAAQVQGWVDEALEIVGLRQWGVFYDDSSFLTNDDDEDDYHHAEITPSDDLTAELKLGEKFFLRSPEYQRLTLTHELSHLFTNPLEDVFALVQGQVTSEVWEVLDKVLLNVNEAAVETIARAVAPLLPLPKFDGFVALIKDPE